MIPHICKVLECYAAFVGEMLNFNANAFQQLKSPEMFYHVCEFIFSTSKCVSMSVRNINFDNQFSSFNSGTFSVFHQESP